MTIIQGAGRLALFCGLALIGLLPPAHDAAAQSSAPVVRIAQSPALETELDRAFQQMLRDPANLDLMFTYAQLAMRAGNYDGAIGTLLRMLLFNPNLPRVRLELGALYFQVNSLVLARSYLQEALAAPDMPPEIRRRALALTAEIDQRLSRHRFAGSLSVGMRHQTNATTGPTSAFIRALGFDAVPGSDISGRPDWSGLAIGTLQHSFYFGEPGKSDTLESTVVAYMSRQFEVHRLNLWLTEATTGPRFRLDDLGLTGASVRGYAIGNFVALGDEPYLFTGGFGVSYLQPWGSRVLGEFTYEHREKRFNNTAERTTATDQNSGENNLQGTLRYALFPNVIASLTAGIIIDDARKDFRSRVEPSGTLSLSYYFDPGFWPAMEPWSVNLAVTRKHARYNAPDPSVDPNVRRIDDTWQGGVLATEPIIPNLTAYQQLLRTEAASTLPNYAYKDLTLAAGFSWKF
jgi:hypothetical protein